MIIITSIATIGSLLSDIFVLVLTVISIIGFILKIISIKALLVVMKEKQKYGAVAAKLILYIN